MRRERKIDGIDFRRAADGTGRLTVALSDPRTPVNVRQEGQQVVVDFVGAKMGQDLVKRYDVVDFATPVQTSTRCASMAARAWSSTPRVTSSSSPTRPTTST